MDDADRNPRGGHRRARPADRRSQPARDPIRGRDRPRAGADGFAALRAPRYYKPAYARERTLEMMDGMAGDHLDPVVVAAVRRNVHDREWTLASMKHTGPKPGDEGMSRSPDSGLSERDQAMPGS